MEKGTSVLERLRTKAAQLWEREGLLRESVVITARTLSTQEAIGDPGGRRLLPPKGQGTAHGGHVRRQGAGPHGPLQRVLGQPGRRGGHGTCQQLPAGGVHRGLKRHTRHLGLSDRTIHCRDKEPTQCARAFADHIRATHGVPHIAQVGYQPKIIESLAERFELRILDLAPDNIGTVRHAAPVEGLEKQRDVLDWVDLWVVPAQNPGRHPGRLPRRQARHLLRHTVAGAAALLGLTRFCAMAK